MTMVALKELKDRLKKDIDNADEKTVLAIQKMLKLGDNDPWNSISDGERQSIKQGLKEAKEGEGIPHEEIKKMYSQWLTK